MAWQYVPPWSSYPPAPGPTNPFVPPPKFGTIPYPSKSASQQTAFINTANPAPPRESGPFFSSGGGQTLSTINPNANPVTGSGF